jgi:hypothetical protein
MSETTPPQKIFVCFSKIEDLDRIMEFYDLNAHQNVRKRQRELIQKLADEGSVVFLEDEDKKIVAASITYPYTEKNTGSKVIWQEIGTTRIVLNGYPGLFDLMTCLQALRSHLIEPPAECFVANMLTAPVQKMAEKLGWRAFVPPQALLDAKVVYLDYTSENNHNTKPPSFDNWYQLPVDSYPILARAVVAAIDNPELTHYKNGDKILLDFSKTKTIEIFAENIRKLAAMYLQSHEGERFNKAVEKTRTAFLKKAIR